MKLDVGVSIPVKCVQLAILTGRPTEEIQSGHSFAWGKGMFRVESVSGDEAVIIRLASHQIRALDQTKVLNPSQFHELDAGWQNPGAQLEEPMREQTTGIFRDPTNPQQSGKDVIPKDQVFPEELKTTRPALREPTKVDDEPRDPSVRRSSIEDPQNHYERLAKIALELHGLEWSNQVVGEMAEGDIQLGYAEYEDVLRDIINEASKILGDMEISRDVFLRERGINPKEIK